MSLPISTSVSRPVNSLGGKKLHEMKTERKNYGILYTKNMENFEAWTSYFCRVIKV